MWCALAVDLMQTSNESMGCTCHDIDTGYDCRGTSALYAPRYQTPTLTSSCPLGVVRASLFTTTLQVFSRVLLVWGIVDRHTAATAPSPFYTSMLLAWSLAEIIRYAYLAQHLRGGVPALLTWLRYVFVCALVAPRLLMIFISRFRPPVQANG